MAKLKNSEQMLCFLKDLSKFTQTFNTFQQNKPSEGDAVKADEKPKNEKENPQSPTSGIADEFIQNILDSYLKQLVVSWILASGPWFVAPALD